MAEMIIVRHARSLYNNRKTSDLDSPVTPYGLKQSQKVGRFLARQFPRLHDSFWFYTSPFLRCLQTAKGVSAGVAEATGRDVFFNVRTHLREYINHGGRQVTVPLRRVEFPEVGWGDFPSSATSETYNDETNEQFIDRIYKFVDFAKRSCVVVTHGLPAMLLTEAMVNRANHVPVWDYSIDNASVTYIKNGRAVWRGRNLHHELEEDVFEQELPR